MYKMKSSNVVNRQVYIILGLFIAFAVGQVANYSGHRFVASEFVDPKDPNIHIVTPPTLNKISLDNSLKLLRQTRASFTKPSKKLISKRAQTKYRNRVAARTKASSRPDVLKGLLRSISAIIRTDMKSSLQVDVTNSSERYDKTRVSMSGRTRRATSKQIKRHTLPVTAASGIRG